MPGWPLDAMTLMWIQVTTGFTGALTLVFAWRWLGKKLGSILHLNVYFSPKGGCLDAAVAEVARARSEVLVQAYSFTAKPLCDALIEARKRGVHVTILLDKSNEVERYSDLHIFLEAGLEPLIDAAHAIAHNKVMVIDSSVVITGSFNFTKAAENQTRRICSSSGMGRLAAKYAANWETHLGHSQWYKGRDVAPTASKVTGPADSATGYVVSKKSSVFHRPTCNSASKIAEGNLVRYASPEEAVAAGKRPCSICKP